MKELIRNWKKVYTLVLVANALYILFFYWFMKVFSA